MIISHQQGSQESSCHSCLSNDGTKRISPGDTIYAGNHFMIEHAYPTALLGWLVIVTKRHVEALHEFTSEEWQELGELQKKIIPVLKQYFNSAKEYFACFAEQEGYAHIHFHCIPRANDLPEHLRGSKVFALLKPENPPVPPEQVIKVCSDLKALFTKYV